MSGPTQWPNVEHAPKIARVHHYDDASESFDVELNCSACGLRGHASMPLKMRDLHAGLEWIDI